ncbi:MAG TPA: class A beta-lactamase-related serine hydrolase [Actinobacteria bacterium]|nr:esterase EstB [bacterium BMS3Bbin02]HDL41901.1 class A beta-lactamase-related serine hydrolase [Actinomycetota bacterium]
MVEVNGFIAKGFGSVGDAFVENFDQRGDVGAAFCAYVRGEKVVDLWGGDAKPGEPWEEDTLALVFSTTKGVTALVATVLADRGLLDVDAPVSHYWPEFAAEGKEGVTVAQVLDHSAGVLSFPNYEEILSVDDGSGWGRHEEITQRLADAPLWWTPGEQHGEHAITYGWIIGEVVRRIDGRLLGTFFRDEIAAPLGLDFWIGLPTEHLDRVADLLPPRDVHSPEILARVEEIFAPDSPSGAAFFVGSRGSVPDMASVANSAGFRVAEIPASNGIGDARSLARMYGALACGGELDGVRIVSKEAIRRHSLERFDGHDLIIRTNKRYAMGYMLPTPTEPQYGPNPDRAFGHPGLGGSLAFADPVAGVGYGYVMNQMAQIGAPHDRELALTKALYECLA